VLLASRAVAVSVLVAVLSSACGSSPSPSPPNGGGAATTAGGNAAGGSYGGIHPGAGDNPRGGNDTAGLAGNGGALPSSGSGGVDTRPSVADGPNGSAFDAIKGALNVKYPEFLSKQDIVYGEPNSDPLEALGFGNGKTGAMAWSQNGLTLQVSGVDLSPQSAFAAGNVTLQTTPPIDAGASSFEQRLVMYDGTLVTRYGDGRVITMLGAPKSEVLGIHVEDDRNDVTAITVELSVWDLADLANAGNVPDLNTWKTVSTFAETDVAGLSRGQTDPKNFGYTLAASVEGAEFSTEKVGDRRVRLNITPSKSYTIWFAAASRLNAPDHDSVAAAKKLVGETKAAGYDETLSDFEAFWNGFWQQSFVQYGNQDGSADYLENLYYLSTYMIAVGAYGNYPLHFINGVWRATQDKTKWSNAYWYWNQRDVYHSFLASNHVDMVEPFNHMYARNSAALQAFTSAHFGVDGIWVPETMSWDGNADGTIYSDYTKLIYSTGMEAAMNMYAQYRYTGDETYLKDTVYPFMKEATKFYVGMLSKDGAGKYFMSDSNAHETYWSVKNAITDLAAVRAMFPVAIALSEKLQLDAALRAQWQDVLDNLVPYPTDATTYLPHEGTTAQERNGENISCELIWPYDVTGLAAPDYARAVATWKARPNPYDNVWANDAVQAARLGLGKEAFDGMKLMLQKYQSYPNGMTNNTNGVFEYLGVHLLVMNESLLQSYDETLRVFPALPPDPSLVTRFTLLARGGHLVSSEREGGVIKYVGLKSLRGEPVTLVNPWGTAEARVLKADGSVVMTASSDKLTFATVAGQVYVIEQSAKPYATFEYAHVSAEPSQGMKDLPGTSCELGIGGPPKPDTGHYEAEKAGLSLCSASGDNAASGFTQVTGLVPGASVTFEKVRAGTSVDITYCTMNAPGQLSLYVNGVHNQDVMLPSTNSWSGHYEVKKVTVSIPAGAALRFQVDAGDAGANLDFIQVN
jgi:alpha-L-fucosidase 2